MTSNKATQLCFIILTAFYFQSCFEASSGSVSNVTTATPVTPVVPVTPSPGVTSNMCTSSTTKIIDYGTRSTAATAGVRGAYSDTAINPANGYPAFFI